MSEARRVHDSAFELMPARGYTALIERMLDHPLIDVHTGLGYDEARRVVVAPQVIWTGAIDAFFRYRFGALPWELVRHEFETVPTPDGELVQPVAEIAHRDKPYRRVTEFRQLTGQGGRTSTLAYEFSRHRRGASAPGCRRRQPLALPRVPGARPDPPGRVLRRSPGALSRAHDRPDRRLGAASDGPLDADRPRRGGRALARHPPCRDELMSTGAPGAVAGYSDAIARVAQIQSQLASIGTAFTPAGATTAAASSASTSSAGAASSTFATQLQSALGTSDSTADDLATPLRHRGRAASGAPPPRVSSAPAG